MAHNQKTATAVAHCKRGSGLIKLNGSPLSLAQPEILRVKIYEPLLLLGQDKFANLDIRVRVSGGGHTSQVYAVRQAIAKAIVAFYQKCMCLDLGLCGCTYATSIHLHQSPSLNNSPIQSLTKRPKRKSKTFSSHTIVLCSSLILVAANPKSLEVLVPARVTRNLIVRLGSIKI